MLIDTMSCALSVLLPQQYRERWQEFIDLVEDMIFSFTRKGALLTPEHVSMIVDELDFTETVW